MFDPRMGYFGISYYDFAAPLDQPLIKRFICRHRLEKTNPGPAPSPVKKPIVYYLDRGTPEPIRTALLEGARWWSAAFEEAGFQNAYRVELLPEGADPLDIRYNVIQWIHRSTRGYSFGGSVVDPRTGEIIKGMVRLDSSRARQDMRIFEGLAGADQTQALLPVALGRIRQLSAHEVGHTLGLAHNFAGSTYGDRASVMDYPGPKLALRADGTLDFAQAYGTGVGVWDKFAIRVGYSTFAADENSAIRQLLNTNYANLVYLTDQDDPAAGGATWRSSKWDNGSDPIASLTQTMAIRRAALDRFGLNNLRQGEPVTQIEEVLGPVYFFHRYDLSTAAKMIGGLDYLHTVNAGERPMPTTPVAVDKQRAALNLVLSAASPDELDVPANVLALLTPAAPGYGDSREKFRSNTTFAFDSLGAANTAADLVFAELLNPARSVRLVELESRPGQPSLPLNEVLMTTIDRVFAYSPPNERRAEIARGVQGVLVDRLMDLVDAEVPRNVRSRALAALQDARGRLIARSSGNPVSAQHSRALVAEIDRFLNRPADAAKRTPKPLPALPGSPIGCGH